MNVKTLSLQESFYSLKTKFTSGNNIPVERNIITREEWEPIQQAISQLFEMTETVKKYQQSLSNADIRAFPSEDKNGKQITKERIE